MADSIRDFIGRSASHKGMRFIPMLGEFEFGARSMLLEDDRRRVQHPNAFSQEPDLEDWLSWWAKARIVHIFGIHPPVSCDLTKPLEFLLGAVPESNLTLDSVRPVLLASIPESAGFGLRFTRQEARESALRIAGSLFDLLLSDPFGLGVFSDYFVRLWDSTEVNAPSSREVALYRIACDGIDLQSKFIGYLRPENVDDDEIDEMNEAIAENCDMLWIRDVPVWPFELPRRRNKGLQTKPSISRFDLR
jgi:hypothetical protein